MSTTAMASLAIDNRILRTASFPDLAKYYKQVLARIENERVTDYLLAGLATDALPFRSVSVWIAGFADAASISKALRYDESAGVRRLAIKRFARCLRSEKQMTAVLDAVGGISGLVKLFAELSVHDVQSFCEALGHTCTWIVAQDKRRALLTQFAQALISEANPDTRTFIKFYANIVPACTIDFVRAWEANEGFPRAGGRWMDHAHYKHTRERCIRQLSANNGKNFKFKYFENVFNELPPLPASKYLSQSMLYSLEVLEFLGEHPDIEMLRDDINNNIFVPLMRRLNKRGAPHAVRAKVLRAMIKALKVRVHDVGIVDMNQHGPLRNVVSCWNGDSEAYQQLLLDVMHLVPGTQRHVALDRVGTLLSLIRKSLRYKLLALATKHLKPLATDLDDDSALSRLGPWPSNIFALLPSEDALSLLRRLIQLRPNEAWSADIFTSLLPEHASSLLRELLTLRPGGDFIHWNPLFRGSGDSVFAIEHNRDVALLQLFVAPASAERDQGWRVVMDEQRKEAARAREQSDRATWIRSAIRCSVASGSLNHYEEIVVWLRRFNRDPLTVKEIYNGANIRPGSADRLLSGVPTQPSKSSSAIGQVVADVQHGNRIMLLLLETAFQALREPSFQPSDWFSVLAVFRAVVEHRISRANEVQDELELSDQRMYEILWKDTLQTLLTAEEQCLMDEHQKLAVQQPVGISGRLDLSWPEYSIRFPQARFLNDLSRGRNEIWEKDRGAQDPNVLSLPAPFPRGLSFQHVLRCRSFKGCAGHLPYLESRAEGLVFMQSSVALSGLPTDQITRKAIGEQVDDYNQALEFYVSAGADEDERRRRKVRAWAHAIGPLSKPRGMSAFQAKLFWQSSFTKIFPAIDEETVVVPPRPDPTVPQAEDPQEPTEWHPDPDPSQWTMKPAPLEAACVDLMLQPFRAPLEHDALMLGVLEPTTPAITRKAFWHESEDRPMKSITPAGREGLLALGLMLINSKCCSSKRLFSKPFPSAEDARFPAMYLDEEFLEREEISEQTGFEILERLSKDAPLTLVAELCEAMLISLGSGDDPRRGYEDETLRLLKILVESDRPDLALNLVRKVVIDRPDASSWHRHMLTPGLFNRLKSQQARQFLQTVEKDIANRLHQQAQRKAVEDGEQAKTSSPMVKVTTVTALAQLLAKATFVNAAEIVDFLVDILSNAHHPDICVAIIQSLTDILRSTRHETVRAKVIDALEVRAVPIASSMNERSPMTEADWQNAEAKIEIPEVNEPQSKSLQPVLRAIIDAYGSLKGDTVPQMYRRILLPILDASAANNRRWMRLFLRKHQLHCNVLDLPPLPPKPSFLPELIKHDVQEQRQEVFHAWGQAVMLNLNPSLDVFNVNNAITSNKDIRASNGGRHWLSLWRNRGMSALSLCGTQLHQYLTTPNTGGIGPLPTPLIQDLVFRQLEFTITDYDTHSPQYEHIIRQLAHPLHKTREWEETWTANVRPLIAHVVEKVESLRTPAWQRQSHRVPATLPETFHLRLWLLTWPGWDLSYLRDPDHEDKVATFATELGSILTALAQSGKPYHTHFASIKDAALSIHPQDFASVALHFGTTDGETLELRDYLAVEIAEALVQKVVEPEGGTAERKASVARDVRAMVARWCDSADETVRMAGIRTKRVFEAQRRVGMGWLWEGRGLKGTTEAPSWWWGDGRG